jgi:hypothetical protein
MVEIWEDMLTLFDLWCHLCLGLGVTPVSHLVLKWLKKLMSMVMTKKILTENVDNGTKFEG